MYKRRKYDYDFRLRCVEAVVKHNLSMKAVAKEKGFNVSNLRLWIGFYRQYGKSGLQLSRKKHYDASFKLTVLETINKELLSLREASVRFKIPSESVIISWRKAYESKGLLGLTPQPQGRPVKMKPSIKRKARKAAKPLTQLEELLEENEYLRAENELLKKLQALAPTNKKQKP